MAARKAPGMATVVSPQPTPEQLVAELVLLFDLEGRGGDKFVGRRQIEGTGRVFGGQAIAQALVAARRTVPDDRHTHSLHAYFLRSGSDALPIEFRVKRDLDGRSFSNRRVVASQDGQPILNLIASFQKPQEGLHHQFAEMPAVPPPEDLEPEAAVRRRFAETMPSGLLRNLMLRPRPIDVRSVEPRNWQSPGKRAPVAHCWFRTVAALPDDPPIHRAVLAYASVSRLGSFYAVAVVVGFIYAGTMPLYAVIIRENFPLRMMGTIIGGTALAGSLGMSTGPLLGGLVYDRLHSYTLMYVASWGMGLAAMAVLMAFRPFPMRKVAGAPA